MRSCRWWGSVRLIVAFLFIAWLFSACSQVPAPPTITTTLLPTLIPSPTTTLAPTASFTATALPPTAVPISTPTPPPFTGLVPPGAQARLSKGGIQRLVLSSDGKAIAIGTSVTVCLYKVVDFSETWCSLADSPSPSSVESLAFDPQGKSLAAGLANGDIVLWDAASGHEQFIIHASIVKGNIRSLAWSPDSSRLASGADDGCISLWDGRTGKPMDSFRPCESDVFSIRWSPDGSMLAAGDFWGQVIVRDAQSGSKVWSQKEPQGYTISDLAWSPNSSLVAAASGLPSGCGEGPCNNRIYAGGITVWDAHSGKQTRQIDAAMPVNAAAFSPDGTQLFAGLENDQIRLYRLADGAVLQILLDVDASKGAAWLPDGKRLLTSNGVDTLIVWDTQASKHSEVQLNGYAQLFGLAWSPDSTRLVTSSYQGTLFIWDNATGQLLRKFEGEGMGASPVAWSPDGKQIASSGAQGVIIWDDATGKRQQVLAVSNTNLYDLSWSADGRYFAALSPDDGVTLWDAHSWQVLRIMNKIGYAVAMAWSPDGKTLATAGMNVFLWDTTSGKQVGVLGQDTATDSIAWSPDGSKIAAASGGWAVIWDVKTGQDLLQATSGHSYYAQSVALSPDGQILASAAGELILRDARNGEILQTLGGHSDAMSQLTFSPDGKTLASSSYGTVVLWDIPPSSTLFATPTPTEVTSETSLPSPKPQETPTQVVMQITPIVTGPSEGMDNPSPDSRWLPYEDFNEQKLHFIDTSNSSICDFPSPINYTGPDHFIAWLPDGRVVFQAASGVETGLPCSTFTSATPAEILFLAHSDPSFSPDGRYQVVAEPYTGTSQGVNEKIDINDAATGKNLAETVFMKVARGGGTLPGYWLDTSHFLIPATVDQGPLLLTPGKPAIKVAADIFHLPLKPGSGEFDFWEAITNAAKNAVQFHLMITASSGASNPLQIYHSETGQVETLPYLASQGAFSYDGHSLLVTTVNDSGQQSVFIRPIDPPGATFQPISSQEIPPIWLSPDGSRYYQVSQDLTTISVYTFPGSNFLGAWQAPDYELSPSWSPDGKYLAVWSRKHSDYNQESIFVIPMPVQK